MADARTTNDPRWRFHGTWMLLVFLAWLFAPGVMLGAETPVSEKSSAFLRFVKTSPSQGHVDTAITTYRHPDGTSVSLVAAVHIADAEYFRKLQKRFADFEAVLYEMVKPKEAGATDILKSGNPIRSFQTGMKTLLNLEFQLDAMDYSRTNFVHADLDTESFSRLQKDKGESILGLLIRAALSEQGQKAAAENPLDPWQLLLALMSKDGAPRLKFMLAEQMEQIESLVSGIDQGEDGKGSVLVSGRNQVAMDVLARQVRQGRKKLAIFYGAGHMVDLERRIELLGFKKAAAEWVVAWDIR